MQQTPDSRPILFYDGVCGYCNWIVRFLARIDKRERLRFAPLQSRLGCAVIARHPKLQGVETAVLVENLPGGLPGGLLDGRERVYSKWQLTRGLWPQLTGLWKVACMLLAAIPLPVGNLIYDLIAKYRYRIFGKHETCKLPEPWLRRRLADFPD
jgi:predicted DCC family thiol-disulfide oxidoreductase YuxK